MLEEAMAKHAARIAADRKRSVPSLPNVAATAALKHPARIKAQLIESWYGAR